MERFFRGKDAMRPERREQKNQESAPGNGGATRLLPETTWASEPMPSGIPAENTVVVTISRQFGSKGSEIARLLATHTGLQYLDHRLIAETAQRLNIQPQLLTRQDEQTSGVVSHILEAIQASNPLNMSYQALLSPSTTLAHANELTALQLTQRVILEMATEGNAVIVGRGSQFLLRNAPRTLHISIFAPLPYRIGNVMQHYQISRSKATQLIEQKDYQQASYLRRYYGNDGQQAALYHLLINTSLFSPTVAAHMISQSLPVIQEIT